MSEPPDPSPIAQRAEDPGGEGRAWYVPFLLIAFCPRCGVETARAYVDLGHEGDRVEGRCPACGSRQSAEVDNLLC